MNELAKIAKESGLPQTKSQALLEIFQEYFGIAAEWEEKANALTVVNESQTDLMLKAREGRKFLQEARIKLEKTRVSLKKFALLEGKAIDGMANVLKASIIPVEQYLADQENFVVNKKKAEAKARQEQAMRDLEAKEAAEEKAEIEKLEKERLENIRLKKKAEEGERKAKVARDKAIATQKKMEEIHQEEKEKHQKEIEKKQRENFEKEKKIRVENEKKLAAVHKERDRVAKEAEAEQEEKAEARRRIGQNRLNLLYQVDAKADFNALADMSNLTWTALLLEKTSAFKVAKEKARLEKERVEKDAINRAFWVTSPVCLSFFSDN